MNGKLFNDIPREHSVRSLEDSYLGLECDVICRHNGQGIADGSNLKLIQGPLIYSATSFYQVEMEKKRSY